MSAADAQELAKLGVPGRRRLRRHPALVPGVALEPSFQHEGLNHFCLAIEDFDGTLAELRARGVVSAARS
jgi:hypothetical protein